MYAVIHEVESTATHGLIPIAGRPLVARQIQWLRSVRCQGIAVQIGSSAESVALGRWLMRGDAIGTNVRLVLSGKPLTAQEIARRAGFPDGVTLLAIPADVLCGGAMESITAAAHPAGKELSLQAPPGLAKVSNGGNIRVFGRASASQGIVDDAWAIRVSSLADAFAIGVAVLEGRLERRSENGILLHASERQRGVWVSRGASIDSNAKLIPPVLIGADSVIRAGACVGPRVFLGDRSVVDRQTRLMDSLVAPGTIVGEDLDLSGIAIDARGMQDLFTGEHATIDETLLLARRDKPYSASWLGKCSTLVAIILLMPIWVLFHAAATRCKRQLPLSENHAARDSLPAALWQTVRGRRSCIGLSEWNDEMAKGVPDTLVWKSMNVLPGLISIDTGLVPEHANLATWIRARLYYVHEKNVFLDIQLVFRCLRRMVRGNRHKVIGPMTPNSSPEMRVLS